MYRSIYIPAPRDVGMVTFRLCNQLVANIYVTHWLLKFILNSFGSGPGIVNPFTDLNRDQTQTKPRPNADQAQAIPVFCVHFTWDCYKFDLYLNTTNY